MRDPILTTFGAALVLGTVSLARGETQTPPVQDTNQIKWVGSASSGLDLSREAGPGYIIEKLGHTTHEYVTLRIAEKFHYAISDRARLWETVEYLPQVDKWDNYIINFEIGVEADLSKSQKF